MQDTIVKIRQYESGDGSKVEDICCDTAFFGGSIDSVFCDRDLFAEIIVRPYLDHEPNNALVAVSGGEVVGYLLGSIRDDFSRLAKLNQIRAAAKIAIGLLIRKYKEHPRTQEHILWLLFKSHSQRSDTPKNAAHFHLELLPNYRGLGVGSRLLAAFEDKLKGEHIDYVYATGIESEYFPRAFTGRNGFQVLSRTAALKGGACS